MTREEAVLSANRADMVALNLNGERIICKRISAITVRYSSSDDILRGKPRAYVQVEVESLVANAVMTARLEDVTNIYDLMAGKRTDNDGSEEDKTGT